MPGRPADYFAYLIRLWRAEPDGPWRASLEDAKTGERLGFADLAQACAYLLERTQRAEEAPAIDAPLRDRGEGHPPDAPTSTGRCG